MKDSCNTRSSCTSATVVVKNSATKMATATALTSDE
jgi:hypothetical protein